jgi:hypothetical protein
METIEIKPNKKLLGAFMIFILLVMIGMTIYIFTSAKYANNSLIKIGYIVFNAYLIYSIYKLIRLLRSNRPTLTISKGALSFSEGDIEHSYKWNNIQDVSVYLEDSNSYLKVSTLDGDKKITLSWLDKSPKKIKELIDVYRSNAADTR